MTKKCPKCKNGKLKVFNNKTNSVYEIYECTNCNYKSYKVKKDKNINFIGKFLNNCYL